MSNMIDGSMMGGGMMGIFGILIALILILGVAALVKYLFFTGRGRD